MMDAVSVTVITPTVMERHLQLCEAVASVICQTVTPVEHLIGSDFRREGPAVIRSRLLRGVVSEWVAFLDDDDLLEPDHLELCLAAAKESSADVIVPWCRFDGPPLPDGYYNPTVIDRRLLRRHGLFPITVLARTKAVRDCGSFRPGDRYEDWSLWNRMMDAGHRFHVLPVVTWTYRRGHGANRTEGTL